jgi:L-amino acid N-acyltransferase YncA
MNRLRIALPKDAADMLRIYAPFILNTGITQETEIPSTENFSQRISSTFQERPWLACEIENEIAGYAYASKHRDRKGYQWCVETSVYVHEKFFGRGVAHALYKALFEILKLQGYVNAYAVITLPNDKSVSFHENFGFTYFTTFKKIGFKLGNWHDVGWWQYQVNEHSDNMSEPVHFAALDKNMVSSILERSTAMLK